MAYNYNPYQFNNPAYYQPQYYQNQQSDNGLIWIQGGLNTAKNYHIAPNTSVPLWDQDEQVIYLKSADASGMATIKILDYTVRDTQPQIQNDSKYATKDDLAEIKNEIAKIAESLNSRYTKRDNNRKEYSRNE